EKMPGGKDKNNPDVAKQSRPTLGMPILIEMKKKPGVDAWEGEVYNAKDGQLYSSTIKPVGTDQLEIQGCVLGFLCGGGSWARGGAEGCPTRSAQNCGTANRGTGSCAGGTEDHGCSQSGSRAEGRARSEAGGGRARPTRRYRRYLPTPRHRAVCPL